MIHERQRDLERGERGPVGELDRGDATDEERERLWPKFVALYPGYEFYQRNARGRKIPIVILDPH